LLFNLKRFTIDGREIQMKNIKRGLFLLALSALFSILSSGSSLAESFRAEVVAISSGDTVKVLKAGEVITVRLEGIDAPNKGQAYSQEARAFSEALVFGKVITVLPSYENAQGQTVGKIILPDGRSLNQELIKSGLAWWHLRSSRDPVLAALERASRKKRLGLWRDSMPLPPWEYPKKLALRR